MWTVFRKKDQASDTQAINTSQDDDQEINKETHGFTRFQEPRMVSFEPIYKHYSIKPSRTKKVPMDLSEYARQFRMGLKEWEGKNKNGESDSINQEQNQTPTSARSNDDNNSTNQKQNHDSTSASIKEDNITKIIEERMRKFEGDVQKKFDILEQEKKQKDGEIEQLKNELARLKKGLNEDIDDDFNYDSSDNGSDNNSDIDRNTDSKSSNGGEKHRHYNDDPQNDLNYDFIDLNHRPPGDNDCPNVDFYNDANDDPDYDSSDNADDLNLDSSDEDTNNDPNYDSPDDDTNNDPNYDSPNDYDDPDFDSSDNEPNNDPNYVSPNDYDNPDSDSSDNEDRSNDIYYD